ncbi:hypothetical protein DM02DRAFT_620465 [Periconia macrospinosa]|uniref:Zn(2)-C6 fungal-type domain-containing protein n=1 Tax=Periconia macrospinosa TaxID=97972 RepID=A0A2V1D1P2_9PLEO|nr:hypothetical protein DM02DRAFT_620465 [Periconia macrospinosa]
MRKRSRACEECHRLKIKCDVSADLGACERCSRNNLECTPAAPRLQRDRIQELETQVQELKVALREQNDSRTPSQSPGSLLEDTHNAILSFVDTRIPLDKQQFLLDVYAHRAGAVWPVIRLNADLDAIRAKSPVLLLSVLAYCDTHMAQGTDLAVHDELVRETVRVLADEVITRGQRSLELVQALLIMAFWNKATRKGYQGSCYQIAQLAADMAIDLGIAGPSLQPSPVAYFSHHEDPTSLEARRTWLACYLLLSASSLQTRRPHATPWDSHHEECVSQLEANGLPSDILLCQIVRITQVTQEIAEHLHLCRLGSFIDGNNCDTHAAMELLRTKVDAWAAQVPVTFAHSQTLKVWHHTAMIHIYELALHTPTNKPAFTAPYIPGRIPVKDFPKPITCIPPLVTALQTLIHHCHGVIDAAGEMDPALVIGLPTFCFAPNVLYSLFVLVTMFAAATDPANTYGQYISADSFLIEQCGMKLQRLSARLKVADPTMSCYTTRLIDALGWLEQWYKDFNAIVQRYKANVAKVD